MTSGGGGTDGADRDGGGGRGNGGGDRGKGGRVSGADTERAGGTSSGVGAGQAGAAAAGGGLLPRDSERRALGFALAGALLLHTAATLWVWHQWRGFGRGGMLAWMDFPSSLAYLRLRGGAKLAWSLVLGGLQWAAIGAGLSLLFGRSARPAAGGADGAERPPAPS